MFKVDSLEVEVRGPDGAVFLREVAIGEATVEEIRVWLRKREVCTQPDQVNEYLFADHTLDELALFTDLAEDEMARIRPSRLEALFQKIEAANPHFFAMAARASRMATLLKDVLAVMPPPSSPETAG